MTWIDAQETKPDNGRIVLVFGPESGCVRTGWWGSFDNRWHIGHAGLSEDISHWQNMPEPPVCDGDEATIDSDGES